MSIFERSRVAVALALGFVAAAALRCGPPEQCLRMSDCAIGFVCVEATCTPEGASSQSEGGAAETSVPDATVREASVPSQPAADASTSDADAATSADTGANDAAEEAAPEF